MNLLLLHCGGLLRSFALALLLSIPFFVNAQTASMVPGTPLCIEDGFGYNWQAGAHVDASGIINLRGTVEITGMDWAFTGFFNPTTKEIQLNADNPLTNDCALTSGAIHYIGVRTAGSLSGNWTNDCGGFGSWTGTMHRGSCNADLRIPLTDDDLSTAKTAAAELNIAPNPLISQSLIQYQMIADGFLTMEVFNMQGISQKVLFEGNANMGVFEISWDGTAQSGIRLPAGNYIVRANETSFVIQVR